MLYTILGIVVIICIVALKCYLSIILKKSHNSAFNRVIRSFLISLKEGHSVDNLSDVLRLREHINFLLDREKAPYLSEIDTIDILLKTYEECNVTKLSETQKQRLINTLRMIIHDDKKGSITKYYYLKKDDETIKLLETCIRLVEKGFGSNINSSVDKYVVKIYKSCMEATCNETPSCAILRWALYKELVSSLHFKCDWIESKDRVGGGNFMAQPNKKDLLECLSNVKKSSLNPVDW